MTESQGCAGHDRVRHDHRREDDLGQVMDDWGVAVRVGHHCAWPTCRRLGVPATTRLSTYLYNDEHDIDVAVQAIEAAVTFFEER